MKNFFLGMAAQAAMAGIMAALKMITLDASQQVIAAFIFTAMAIIIGRR